MQCTLIFPSSTRLARELYTKDVRFIFELLQNADDNHYSKATEANSEPFVTFHHYHNKVIVECNEDGFSEANIRAICSIGQSSKTGAQGYIGEKGIGFKSIFKVAWKAHIQSGPYCFAFIHRPGDLGMGMISPEWETSSERLDGPLTRITLLLHEEDNRRQKINVNAQRKSIKEQLQTLQSTMLLFLKKLKRVNIHFHEEQETTSISMNLDRDTFNARTILSRRETHGGQSTEEKTFYHVTTQIVTGLARSDNRNYSEAEESTRAYSRAEVILAFPLSEDSVPIVQPQEVFAFLPVRQYGFNVSYSSYACGIHLITSVVHYSQRLCHFCQPRGYRYLLAPKFRPVRWRRGGFCVSCRANVRSRNASVSMDEVY